MEPRHAWAFDHLQRSRWAPSPLTALVLAAAAYLAGLGGRVRLERRERAGPWASGFLVALAASFVLMGCAAFGNTIAYWPLVPVGGG